MVDLTIWLAATIFVGFYVFVTVVGGLFMLVDAVWGVVSDWFRNPVPPTLPTRKTVAAFGLTFVGVVLFVLAATQAIG